MFLKRLLHVSLPGVLTLSFASFCVAQNQQQRSYVGYTVVKRTVFYDSNGVETNSFLFTTYHSSSGSFRSVSKSASDERATIYWRGRGVYTTSARTGVMIKESDHAPGCPIRTATELNRQSKFVRTDTVVGLTAYVTREVLTNLVIEHYWAAEEGGGTPLKTVSTLADGSKVVTEPVSLVFGEPAAGDVTGPPYRVIEQTPYFNKDLQKQLLNQPQLYPIEGPARRLKGTVFVSVIVDESGRVLVASTSAAYAALGEAAIEAAYRAFFSPTICNGVPVVSRGALRFEIKPMLF